MHAQATLYRQQDWLVDYMRSVLGLKQTSKTGVCFGLSVAACLEFVVNQQDRLKRTLAQAKSLAVPTGKQWLTQQAFFGAVELLQHPYTYSAWFPADQVLSQSGISALSLASSAEIEAAGGAKCFPAFSGAYSPKGLLASLRALKAVIRAFTSGLSHQFTFMLRSSDHALMVSFDKTSGQWQLINASQLKSDQSNDEFEKFATTASLVKALFKAFSQTKCCILSTYVFTTASAEPEIGAVNRKWQASADFRRVHTVTPQKATVVDLSGQSWLYLSVVSGNVDEVRQLLQQGADINECLMSNGATLAFLAAERGNLEMLEVLGEHGADVALACNDGMTPLMTAAAEGAVQVVRFLLECGVNPNERGERGMTALYLAASRNRPAVVEALLSHPSINIQLTCVEKEFELTPLQIAKWRGEEWGEVISLLKEKTRLGGLFSVCHPALKQPCENNNKETKYVVCI